MPVDMLQSWIDDEDVEEQQETGEYLVQVLDEERLSYKPMIYLLMNAWDDKQGMSVTDP